MNVRIAAAVLFLIVTVGCERTAAVPADPALAMVEALGLGNSLGPMALLIVKKTQTYPMIAAELGEDKANALVRDELKRLLPTYQEQWNKNLASAYAEHFTPEEMQSLAREKQKSPYRGKMKEKQAEVGKAMQAKSSGLLNEFATKGLTSAFEKSAPSKR